MKILFVLEYHHPHVGGVETLFKGLSEKLASQGYQVTVLTNRYSPNLAKEETLNGVRIKRYNFINRYLFTFLAIIPVILLARRHDIIHTTSYNAGLPAFFGGLLTGKKVIITFHEMWGHMWYELPFLGRLSKRVHYLFEWFLVKLPFKKYVAVSDNTKRRLVEQGVSSERVIRIYNGLDYADFSPKEEDQRPNADFRFCYFGRLGISKGLDILLPAIKLCRDNGLKFKFTLIIPSESTVLSQYVFDYIQDHNLIEIIDIQHDLNKEDLQMTIKNCDAVIIPSYSEGFGFTAVESMALNIPIISSGRGSLNEVIGGKHIHFDPFTAQSLATAMSQAVDGKWENKPQKIYSLDDSILEYCQLYEQIVRDKQIS